MAAKKQPPIDLVELSAQLFEIKATIQLCAFAAEARRVLEDLSATKNVFSDLRTTIDSQITASNDWQLYDDTSGLVLRNLSIEVQRIIDVVDDHS